MVVPRPAGRGQPAARTHDVQHVAQQHQVDAVDWTIAAARAPGRAPRQVAQSFANEVHEAGRQELSRSAVGDVQVADDGEHVHVLVFRGVGARACPKTMVAKSQGRRDADPTISPHYRIPIVPDVRNVWKNAAGRSAASGPRGASLSFGENLSRIGNYG